MTKRPVLSLVVLSYTLTAHVFTLLLLFTQTAVPQNDILALLIFLVISAGLALFEFFVEVPLHYRITLGIHIITLIFGQYFLSLHNLSELLLISTLLAGIAIYEELPVNIILSIAAVIIINIARVLNILFTNSMINITLLELISESIGMILIHSLMSALACNMIFFREKHIDSTIYSNKVEQAIGKLTRANYEYQDFLIKIEAESSERERKRITRDIHDVVGYTLTNNIMLMEAATDMARTNPIGLTKLLNTARENAQEGLEQIRESLYSYRQEKDFVPYGLHAIIKLINSFELATGIKVTMEYSNVPFSFNTKTDAVVYHVIQESVINALRHGRSTKIRILMNINDQVLKINIRDNGIGIDTKTGSIKTGIGLKGMRERLVQIGGELRFGNVVDGFIVTATIPLNGLNMGEGSIGDE